MRVGDLDIAIRPIHDRVRTLCADYLTPSHGFDIDRTQADLAVATTASDIAYERRISDEADRANHEGTGANAGGTVWADDYLETLAVFRHIAEYAPLHQRCVFHGATIEVGGRAYIFTAPSGTGKTTHIRMWRQVFGERVNIINGDKPMLRIVNAKAPEADATDGLDAGAAGTDTTGTGHNGNVDGTGTTGTGGTSILAYGTPWCGKEGWQRNTHAPVAGICVVTRAVPNAGPPLRTPDPAVTPPVPEATDPVTFVDEHGVENSCGRVDPQEVLPVLMRQTYIPSDPLAVAGTLGLLDELLRAVPVYRLTCTVSEAAVRASAAAMLPSLNA